MHLFAQLSKIDEARREVWGVATAEVVDKEGEIFDYASSKPYFEAWSDEISKATDGKSLGNVREMHEPSAVGKLVAIDFDDQLKQVRVGAKIVDDTAWQKCTLNVYTGFSIGGAYVKAWKDGEFTRFTANPVEISVVDNPCVPGAHFTAIKTDGTSEIRKFNQASDPSGPQIKMGEQNMQDATARDKEQMERTTSAAGPPAHAGVARDGVAALSKLAEVEKSLTVLRREMESNNQEIQKSLTNLLQLLEKLLAPEQASARVSRAAVPSVTVRKEDDGRPVDRSADSEPSVHDLLKHALQHPQRAANYLR